MRTSPESVCIGVPGGRRAKRPAPPRGTSSRTPAAGGLTFPSFPCISEDVPTVIERTGNRRVLAEITQFLLDAGAITSRRYCGGAPSLQEVCQHALDSWLAATIGDVKCFTPAFELHLADATEDCNGHLHARDSGAARSREMIEVIWKETSVCHWGVGAGLDYVEQRVPALGSTILDVMERKGGHAYPLFTPGMALDEASYLYWRGEEDEALALDEDCGDDQSARDAMRQDMITRADIAAAFPAWALDYKRPRLATQELSRIAATYACPYVQRAAALAAALDGTRTTAQYCVEEDGPFIGFGAVLCWREGDLSVQISDDYAQLAWQGDYCDEIGKVAFSLSDPAAMRRWMRRVKPNLSAIKLLDDLLLHLTERE